MERLIPLGWGIFGWVNRWCVIPVFDFLRNYIPSFGIVILILADPDQTRHLAADLQELRLDGQDAPDQAAGRMSSAKKYPKQEDAMKKQQATMELYKKGRASTRWAAASRMLIQMPILIAVFRFFPASIELRDQSFLWADDLFVVRQRR